MALRRGFKSEAERIARDVQMELGMSAAQSVTPEVLADLLDIELRAGDELIPRERFTELERVQPGAFSRVRFDLRLIVSLSCITLFRQSHVRGVIWHMNLLTPFLITS